MRRAARKDANHNDIVNELTSGKFGILYEVIDMSGAGNGITDIWIPHNGFNFMVELKDPKKPPSARKLTSAQLKLHARAQKGQITTQLTAKDIHDYIQNYNYLKFGL